LPDAGCGDKPIARWQIWLGKWLGIVSLNAALLALSGACVLWACWNGARRNCRRAEQTVLREQVLVARGSAKERNYDREIDAATERILQGRLKNSRWTRWTCRRCANRFASRSKRIFNSCRRDIRASGILIWASPKNFLKDKPLQLRVKFKLAAGEIIRHVCRHVAGRRCRERPVLAKRADEPGAEHHPRIFKFRRICSTTRVC